MKNIRNDELLSRVSILFDELYNKGNPIRVNLSQYVLNKKWSFNSTRELSKFFELITLYEWADLWPDNEVSLTEKGQSSLDSWESYLHFVTEDIRVNRAKYSEDYKKEKRKSYRENVEFYLKNSSSIVAILLSLSVLVTTIISLTGQSKQRQIENELKQIKLGQDSLLIKLKSQ